MSKKLKIIFIFTAIFTFLFLICGFSFIFLNSNFNSKVVIKEEKVTNVDKDVWDHRDDFLIKYDSQTEEERNYEDQSLMQKYANYDSYQALMPTDNPNLAQTNKVLLFLDGGPIFLESKRHAQNLAKSLYNLDISDFSYETTFDFPIAKIEFLSNRHEYFVHSANKVLKKMQKYYKSTSSLPALYGFKEAQVVLTPDIFSKVYSYAEMTEIEKMSSIILHQVIMKFHQQHKQVYLWGSSFGAMVLYNYLTRYGNDAEGMFLAGAPINSIYGIYNQTSETNFYPMVSLTKKYVLDNWSQANVDKYEVKPQNDLEKLYQTYTSNHITLVDVANNLTNTTTLSQRNLNDSTIIVQGSEDKRFDYYESVGISKHDWKIVEYYTHQNIIASGVKYMILEGATHTANWKIKDNKSLFASPFVVANMILGRKPLDVRTKNKVLAIYNLLK